MTWRRPLGLVVFLTLAAWSCAPEEPPTVPSDPALPGGAGNSGDPGSGNPGSSDAGTSDAGTGTPSDGGIPNNDAGIPNNDAGIPNNDAGIPNNDAGIPNNDAGIPNNDAGTGASLQPEACVPWTGAQPPREESPCEVDYQSSQESTRKRYDAQGNLLEQRTWAADGRLIQVETHAWTDGLETLSRTENSVTSWWMETVSTFNAQRQVATRVQRNASSPVGSRAQYIYVAGRLERIEETWGDDAPRITRYLYAGERLVRMDQERWGVVLESTHYTYDDAGRLSTERLLSENDSYEHYRKAFTYHPNDRLQQIEAHTPSSDTLEAYDSRGNLLRRWSWNTRRGGGEKQRQEDWVYAESNRVMESSSLSFGDRGGAYTRWMNSLTANGQEQLSWSVNQQLDPVGDDKGPPSRSTVRRTYLCGTALKDHVDTDLDGNGTVDARCTYTRNAQGALVREECVRLPADPANASSTDYRYDCR